MTVVDNYRQVSVHTVMVSIEENHMVEGLHDMFIKADKIFEGVNLQHIDMLVLSVRYLVF